MKRLSLLATLFTAALLLFIAFPAAVMQADSGDEGLAAAACDPGAWKCSDDAYMLKICEAGKWKTLECMRERGQMCEAGACVDPWRYGSPQWPRVEDEPRSTPESLAEKAAYYDDLAVRLHLNPDLKFVLAVSLPCKQVECGPGEEPPCEDCARTAIPQEEADWRDVVQWHPGANDGLFSGLYLAALAFRYAVTQDPETLRVLKILLEGQATRMEITGVPGIFTRSYIPPGVPGIQCPEDLDAYVPVEEKNRNKWVKIGDDGCVWYVDAQTREWTASDHCGLDKYAGWCWLDNVSKDEYSGHLFLLASLAKLVDDPEVQSTVKDLLLKVGEHMLMNNNEFVDWDGKTCQHGRIRAMAMDDYMGFNAAMALSFVKVAAEATDDPRLHEWYDDCLLQKGGRQPCMQESFETPAPYDDYLKLPGLYVGFEGCGMNYNNISMHMLSMFDLIWFEQDPEYREKYQHSFDVDVFRAPGHPRAVMFQNNAWFNFMWASMKRLGPGSDGPAYDAVENGIRMLRQFPSRKHAQELNCPPDKCFHYCDNRFRRPTGSHPREIAERCIHRFIWWRDPYSLDTCALNTSFVQPPQDYLLAYWMGRYFGFISEDM